MKTTFKKLFKFALIAPLLMAFQCDDEVESTLFFTEYKSVITPQATFELEDTVWISGRISSNVFDTAVNDSVFNADPQSDTFSVYKLMEPTVNANCKDAIDKFEIIIDRGEPAFLGVCENAQMQVLPELDTANSLYTYRIGLKALEAGDYVISWEDDVLQNTEKNISIIENYLIANDPNKIAFDRCDIVSSKLFTESNGEYFFSVE